jgi:hypothetical protein
MGQAFLLREEKIDAMNAPMEPLAGLVKVGVTDLGMSGGRTFFSPCGEGSGVGGLWLETPSMIGVAPSSAFHFASYCRR